MKRLIFTALFVVIVFPASLHAQDETGTNPFGIVEGYWRPAAAQELGVSWDRVTFDWSRIQPNGPGDLDIGFLRDEWLETDREIVGTIVNTPVWASDAGTVGGVPVGLYTPYDNPENQWAVFLRQLIPAMAERGIHDWIIWNAPDNPQAWEGTPADYYRLIKIAYQTIHELDPEARVITGGLEWWHDVVLQRELFLKQFIVLVLEDPFGPENGYFFDAVGVNILLRGTPIGGVVETTDTAGDITVQVRDILRDAALDDKEIWITELNALPTLDSETPVETAEVEISLEHQADFIVQASALGLAAGADRIAVHKMYDSNFVADETPPYGLLREDNSARPAYNAYALVVEQFTPFMAANGFRSANGRLVVIEKPEETVYVMWAAETTAVDFWIEADFEDEFALMDVSGASLETPRIGVGINGENVYVIPTTPAEPAEDDIVRVAGSPVMFVLEGPPRSVWVALEGNALQLR